MKRKLFLCIYKIYCLKYTIPTFETLRAKIEDFTNTQSCAILPQKWSGEWVELSPEYRYVTSFWCQKFVFAYVLYCKQGVFKGRKQSILTTLFVRGTRNAISTSFTFVLLTFCHAESIFWHQNDVTGCCHVVF